MRGVTPTEAHVDAYALLYVEPLAILDDSGRALTIKTGAIASSGSMNGHRRGIDQNRHPGARSAEPRQSRLIGALPVPLTSCADELLGRRPSALTWQKAR